MRRSIILRSGVNVQPNAKYFVDVSCRKMIIQCGTDKDAHNKIAPKWYELFKIPLTSREATRGKYLRRKKRVFDGRK